MGSNPTAPTISLLLRWVDLLDGGAVMAVGGRLAIEVSPFWAGIPILS